MLCSPQPTTPLQELGTHLEAARNALRLSRHDVASRALIDESVLSRWETGTLKKQPHLASLINVIQVLKPGFWRLGSWESFCYTAQSLGIDPDTVPPGGPHFGLAGEINAGKARLVLGAMRGYTFDGEARSTIGLGLRILKAIEESGEANSAEALELLSVTCKELAYAYNQVHRPAEYHDSVHYALLSLQYAHQVTAPPRQRRLLEMGAETILGGIARVLSEEQIVNASPEPRTLLRRIHQVLPRAELFEDVLTAASTTDRIWALINLIKQEPHKTAGNASAHVIESLYAQALNDLHMIDRQTNEPVFRAAAAINFGQESSGLVVPAMLHEAAARALGQLGAEREAHDRLLEARNVTYFTYGAFQNDLTNAELLLRATSHQSDGIELLTSLAGRAPGPYPRHKIQRMFNQLDPAPPRIWSIGRKDKNGDPLDQPLLLLRPLATPQKIAS